FALAANDNSPEQRLPERCRTFLKSERARLVDVWGIHEPSCSIVAASFSKNRAFAILATSEDLEDDGGVLDQHMHPDLRLQVWDIKEHRKTKDISLGIGEMSSLALSPDGKRALVGYTSRMVELRDVATGNIIRSFKEAREYISALAFSSDEKWALVGD